MSIVDNIAHIQETIAAACARAGRDPDSVTLVAVSKYQPVDAVLQAMAVGLHNFGESRVEEAQEKIPAVNQHAPSQPIWHMIGHIQSRKAKHVMPLFDMVESVDRLKIASKLSDFAGAEQKKLPVLVEVNISGEEAKHGFNAAQWQHNHTVKDAFWHEFGQLLALPHLEIRGLMTMAPFYDEMERTRPVFASLAELRAALCQSFDIDLPDLSMGMSNDYPVAIEEGATIVRIGRAVFSTT